MPSRVHPAKRGDFGRLFSLVAGVLVLASAMACAGRVSSGAPTGAVVVVVIPPGPVVVWVDDRRVAVREAPLGWVIPAVPTGARRVAVSRDGFLVERRTIVVEEAATSELSVEFWPAVPELDGAVGR